MRLQRTAHFTRAYGKAPKQIQRALDKQAQLLLLNLHHPSLHAKKYSEAEDKWQARVTKSWRFYFKIIGATYVIEDIIPHPKK